MTMTHPLMARRTLLASLAAFALPSQSSFAASRVRDPAAVVAEIYAGNDKREAALGLDRKDRRKYFSKSIDALWTRAEAKVNPHGDEAGPIDWDVSTNSQGMEVKSLTRRIEHQDATHATVVVTLTPKGEWVRKSPDQNIIRYHFILENGRWAIDDVRSADDAAAGGLRDLLAQALKR